MFGTLARNVRTAVPEVGPGLVLSGLAAAALLSAPAGLGAQQEVAPGGGSISFDARAGAVVPVDEFMDETTDTGASFGGGAALHLSRHLALRGDVEYQDLSGGTDDAGTRFPDMTLFHATGGVEVHFNSPETRWTGSLSLGGGMTTLETDATLDGGAASPVSADFSKPSFRGGMKLAYRATHRLDVYFEPAIYLLTFDREDTAAFNAVSEDIVGNKSSGWVLPLQVGLRYRLR